jgi:hypothetical protein
MPQDVLRHGGNSIRSGAFTTIVWKALKNVNGTRSLR